MESESGFSFAIASQPFGLIQFNRIFIQLENQGIVNH